MNVTVKKKVARYSTGFRGVLMLVALSGIPACGPGMRGGSSTAATPVFRNVFQEIAATQFSPDGQRILVADATGVTLLNRGTGEQECQTDPIPFTIERMVRSAKYTTDGIHVVVAGNTHSIQCLNGSKLEIAQEIGQFEEPPEIACPTPDGTGIIAQAKGYDWIRLDVATGAEVWRTRIRGNNYGVHACSKTWFAAGEYGENYAASGGGGVVCLYDVATGEKSPIRIEHKKVVRGLAFSPDGRLLASTSDDGMLRVHDVETGDLEWEVLCQVDGAFGVAMHPDGDLIAVGAMRGIKLWSLEERKLEASWNAHTWFVHRLDFSRDGSQLVSGSADKSVALWNLDQLRGRYT
jgi:WD40 repeat protein